jgi:DNA-binding transcriptional LysR family regulator
VDTVAAMRLFARIVERRSFTLAAQDLGLPRSTATETLQQMEARLGVRLLQRTTREAYYRRCMAILADIEEAESAFTGAKPTGMLRIDVHGTLARHFVLPGLPEFLAAYPGLQLHLSEGDRLVDLVREGIDCVLRVGELHDSSMVGRRIAVLEEVTCASPAYAEQMGMPRTLDELDAHRMIGFISTASGNVLPLEFEVDGTLRHMTLPTSITVTGAEMYVAAARLGLGLIQVPRYHVADDLTAGTLVEVLPAFPPSPTPVSLLYPHNRQLSPRVRVFIDWLSKAFATHNAAA